MYEAEPIYTIFVAFRGTKNVKNVALDLKCSLIDYDGCEGCKVHSGFYKAETLLEAALLEKVMEMIESHPGVSLCITGHSLGGALALLFGIKAAQAGFGVPVSVYTFGQPRVGNKEFIEYAEKVLSQRTDGRKPSTRTKHKLLKGDKLECNYYRFVNDNDPIPHFPRLAQNFYHGGL